MNTKFRILIGLMVVAMLCLVAFQWYWIKTGIATKRQQFDRNVMESMHAAIGNIERQEVIFLAKQHLKSKEEERLLAASTAGKFRVEKSSGIYSDQADSTQKNRGINSTILATDYVLRANVRPDGYQTELLVMPEQGLQRIRKQLRRQQLEWDELNMLTPQGPVQQQDIDDFFKKFDAEVISIGPDYSRTFAFPYYTVNRQSLYSHENKNLTSDSPVLGKKSTEPSQKIPFGKETSVQEKFQKTKDKVTLIKDVFADFMRGERNIYERLNQTMLDTLLRKELIARGITIPFEYGVKNNEKMLFSSYAVNYNPTLLEKAYNVRLFPNDAEPQNQFLYVYFTDKDDFILTNMWSVFGSSFLLILMIGGIFYTSMNTIMRQKKLSVIKNDFINNMTHEFKTPISTISLAVQVLKDKSVVKDELKSDRYLGIIQNENHRLGTQVEKVLQMAQLDKGDVQLNFTSVSIHEIIEQVLNNIAVQIEQKDGVVYLEMDAENDIIQADEVHLTNIIYNLLDNANKYSPKQPHISIATQNTPEGLSLKISDQGMGMSKEQLNKIFDQFYRIPTGNVHDVKGFGLGLSYVKKMVDWHHGSIHVSSKINEGTTFEIILPNEV